MVDQEMSRVRKRQGSEDSLWISQLGLGEGRGFGQGGLGRVLYSPRPASLGMQFLRPRMGKAKDLDGWLWHLGSGPPRGSEHANIPESFIHLCIHGILHPSGLM